MISTNEENSWICVSLFPKKIVDCWGLELNSYEKQEIISNAESFSEFIILIKYAQRIYLLTKN